MISAPSASPACFVGQQGDVDRTHRGPTLGACRRTAGPGSRGRRCRRPSACRLRCRHRRRSRSHPRCRSRRSPSCCSNRHHRTPPIRRPAPLRLTDLRELPKTFSQGEPPTVDVRGRDHRCCGSWGRYQRGEVVGGGRSAPRRRSPAAPPPARLAASSAAPASAPKPSTLLAGSPNEREQRDEVGRARSTPNGCGRRAALVVAQHPVAAVVDDQRRSRRQRSWRQRGQLAAGEEEAAVAADAERRPARRRAPRRARPGSAKPSVPQPTG